jgi:hypothetical protein
MCRLGFVSVWFAAAKDEERIYQLNWAAESSLCSYYCYCFIFLYLYSIATRYGLDGPGIESWWGRNFHASVQTGPTAQPASYTMGTASFLEVKWPQRGLGHPPPASAEVEERLELNTDPTLDLPGLFWVELCLYQIFRFVVILINLGGTT